MIIRINKKRFIIKWVLDWCEYDLGIEKYDFYDSEEELETAISSALSGYEDVLGNPITPKALEACGYMVTLKLYITR